MSEHDAVAQDTEEYDELTRVPSEVVIPDVDGNAVVAEEEGADTPRPPFSWRLLWAYTGPGWLMSIAYLDPGNLESDLQAGACTGYQLIWVLFWSTMLGLVLQILAARLGVVTGHHLAQLCREQYRPVVSKALWVMAELAIIGSDIQEVIGSAIAFKILFGLPLWAGVLITGLDTFTFLGLHAFGIRKLEALFAVLIATMAGCFFVEVASMRPSAAEMAEGMLPDVSDYAVVQAVSILGAVIMPHNIFLHSALVQSRDVDRTRVSKVKEANFYFSIEAAVALGVSFFINLAVVSVFASGFFDTECAKQGLALVTDAEGLKECGKIGLEGAGEALSNLLGDSASKVWAVGLLAAGQSSVMTGTFAGQYVMEGFLTLRVAPWKRVLFTRLLALAPAVLVALVAKKAGSEHAGDEMDEYLNILQSIQLPFALLPLMHFTGSKRIMGPVFVNGRLVQSLGWTAIVGIMGINFYLVASQIFDVSVSGLPDVWWMYLIMSVILVGYCYLLVLILENDAKFAYAYVKRAYKRWQVRRGGSAAQPLVSDEVEGEMTLEEQFDQPEKGSPAWHMLQRDLALDGAEGEAAMVAPREHRSMSRDSGVSGSLQDVHQSHHPALTHADADMRL